MSQSRARLATTARCRSPSPKSRPRRASGMARRYSSRSPTDTLRVPDYCHQVASGSQAARCSGVHCCCDCCAAAGEVANVSARATAPQRSGAVAGSVVRRDQETSSELLARASVSASPRPEQSDQDAPDQPAKIAHRERVSADSRSRSAVGGAADVFGPGGGNGAAQPPVDVKSLHAKIGELTLENDFLEGALSKAGLLSARR
jgi:hypothetical protein